MRNVCYPYAKMLQSQSELRCTDTATAEYGWYYNHTTNKHWAHRTYLLCNTDACQCPGHHLQNTMFILHQPSSSLFSRGTLQAMRFRAARPSSATIFLTLSWLLERWKEACSSSSTRVRLVFYLINKEIIWILHHDVYKNIFLVLCVWPNRNVWTSEMSYHGFILWLILGRTKYS